MIHTIIIHVGYKSYLEENINITSKTNKIILVGDSSIKRLGELNNVEYIDIDKYLHKINNIYKPHFINYSSNNMDFEFICFARVFIIKEILKDLNINSVFHIDSDNILLKDINSYPFNKETAYIINKNYENTHRMSNSIHCGLINKKFCDVFENLYNDIYINKSKFYLIKDKINYHTKNGLYINGGICDMTFYYLINNIIEVQNLSLPVVIDNKKYVFINNFNNAEGFESKTQYSLNTNNKMHIYKNRYNDNVIYDEINKEEIIIFNIHFQGQSKHLLDRVKLNNILQLNTNFLSVPSSFSTLCTKECKQELIGFLLSLSLHHPNAKTYVICDNDTKTYIENSTPQPRLEIIWYPELDKYSQYNRVQMEENGLWSDFQMEKATIIKKALEKEEDTLLLDSDTIILDTLYVDKTKELGVSPQFIKNEYVNKTGYYNGGMLWTNQKTLPTKWIEYTKTSRYYDQASIEDLTKYYTFFEFGENYNLQTWRFILGIENSEKILSYLNIKNNKIYYKNEPLKFIHTHFNLTRFNQINSFFIQLMNKVQLWRELAIVFRVINNKWILQIPKQRLMKGIWNHQNDSYRELALLFKINNEDVDIEYNGDSGHCWLKPNILTYDRPTLQWANEELTTASLLLLGNGDIDIEGKKLNNKGIYNVKPWIFWARKPMIVEKIIKEFPLLEWNKRNIESIFIGNFENPIQEKYRNTNIKWEDVITEYHCTKGSTHKFTPYEYLMKLRESKFGLCLRGYGSKCHREVELMSMGTVPIITPGVSIKSYYNPPIEGIHYITVNTPKELLEKIQLIHEDKWSKMSNACYEWYQQNVYSKQSWINMINYILYDI